MLVVGLPAVAVEGVSAEGLTATVLPRRGRALGSRVDGVLGQDFCPGSPSPSNYQRSRIVWHDADYVRVRGGRLTWCGAGSLAFELPQPASAAGVPPTLRRFVPIRGDTLVLFGERRAAV